MPYRDKALLRQCLSSVQLARKFAGYEVNVFVEEGIQDHLGLGRKKGYAEGTSKWKTYVDDDDFVLPNAFSALAPYLDRDVIAICPREHSMQNGKLHATTVPRHHLITFDSEFINEHDWENWIHFGDVAAIQKAMQHPKGILELEDVLYVHRIYYNSEGRRLRRKYPEERERLLRITNEPNH